MFLTLAGVSILTRLASPHVLSFQPTSSPTTAQNVEGGERPVSRLVAKRSLLISVTLAVFGLWLAGAASGAANTPPVANAGGPYLSAEGSEIHFNASQSSDADLDSLVFRWDFQNGSLWDTNFSSDPTASFTWLDDYFGQVVIAVNDGNVTVTAIANVSVVNVVPIPDGGPDRTVDEGEPIQFAIRFWDPGRFDWWWNSFTVDFDGGGVEHKARPELVLDSVVYGSVTLHTTLHANDEMANDLELEAIYGKITSDTYGVTTDSFPLGTSTYARNFVPDIPAGGTLPVTIVMQPATSSTCPNQTEPGALQWHITRNGAQLSAGTFSNLTANCTLPFVKSIGDDCGLVLHTFRFKVVDSNGGIGVQIGNITVRNVPPVVNAGTDLTAVAGEPVHFNGSFSDQGWLDTHTIEWNFGDGGEGGTGLTPTHRFQAPGTYNITLKVTDDNGGISTDTLTMTVAAGPPNFALILLVIAVAALIVLAVFVRARRLRK